MGMCSSLICSPQPRQQNFLFQDLSTKKAPCKSNQQMFVEEVFIATSVYSADKIVKKLCLGHESTSSYARRTHRTSNSKEKQRDAINATIKLKLGNVRAPAKDTDT